MWKFHSVFPNSCSFYTATLGVEFSYILILTSTLSMFYLFIFFDTGSHLELCDIFGLQTSACLHSFIHSSIHSFVHSLSCVALSSMLETLLVCLLVSDCHLCLYMPVILYLWRCGFFSGPHAEFFPSLCGSPELPSKIRKLLMLNIRKI